MCFCFNDTATTQSYTSAHSLSLHDALPISERVLCLSARRSLPQWRSDTFLGTTHSDHMQDADVVLFADTFNNYLESENARAARAEEHTSELQSLMRISYAVF